MSFKDWLIRLAEKTGGHVSTGPREDWEGRWNLTPAGKELAFTGKVEWEERLNGTFEIQLRIHGVRNLNGKTISVVHNDSTLLQSVIRKTATSGDSHFEKISYPSREASPDLSAATLELREGNVVLATTTLRPD